MLNSPKSYSEMLPQLGIATAISTFCLFVVLQSLGVLPIHQLPNLSLKEETWFLSYGLVPLVAMLVAYTLSRFLQMHYFAASITGILSVWNRKFIVHEMVKVTGLNNEYVSRLSSKDINTIMNSHFYPKLAMVDRHYIDVFWTFALSFWVLFEHTIIVAATSIYLIAFELKYLPIGVIIYLIVCRLVTLASLFVAASKSTDQVRQIEFSDEEIKTLGADIQKT